MTCPTAGVLLQNNNYRNKGIATFYIEICEIEQNNRHVTFLFLWSMHFSYKHEELPRTLSPSKDHVGIIPAQAVVYIDFNRKKDCLLPARQI